MDRARIHEGIGRMPFTDIFGRSERSELSQMEAAELLGINDCGFAVEHLHEQLGKRLSMSPTLATLHTPSRAGADFVPGSCDSLACRSCGLNVGRAVTARQ